MLALLLARSLGRPAASPAAAAVRLGWPPVMAAHALIVLEPLLLTSPPLMATELEAALRAKGKEPRFVDEETALSELQRRDPDLNIVVVLGSSSMVLLEASAQAEVLLYSWQAAAGMYKRLVGSDRAGPTWFSPQLNQEQLEEARGWGYLSGDEDKVLDVGTMTDDELRRFLPCEDVTPPADGTEEPLVSELGYSLHPEGLPPEVNPVCRFAITPLSVSVLCDGATEPKYARVQADGRQWVEDEQQGCFVSPLSGAPLFQRSHEIGFRVTGWPAFRMPCDGDGAEGRLLLQHLRTSNDISGGVLRAALVDATSGGHLGHVDSCIVGQLCLNGAALLFVPRGEAPAAFLPKPAAPAINKLLARRPEWLGRAYVATLAGGCFWGLRASLAAIPGVLEAVAGFTGGESAKPTYKEVCSGRSGHVEAVQLAIDPEELPFTKMLASFWAAHDPTTALRQGADVGPQYQPIIFYHSKLQLHEATTSRWELEVKYSEPIVTQIRPATCFWEADAEHQR